MAQRLYEGVLLGLLAALLASAPAALRASEAAPFWWCYLAALGGAASVLGPVVSCLRAARPLPLAASGLFWALAVSIGPLAFFATLLKEKTHHRPLAGATFAVVAAAVLIAAALVMSRLYVLVRSESQRQRWLARVTIAAFGCFALVSAGLMVVPALGVASPLVRGGVLDGVLLFIPGVLLAFAPIEKRLRIGRLLGRIAVALWLCTLLLAIWAFSIEPVRQAMVERAPAMLGFLWLLL